MNSILIVADHYLPGFKAGGPIVSLSSLVAQLQTRFRIKVITRCHDFNDFQPYSDIEPDTWLNRNGVEIFYFSSLLKYCNEMRTLSVDTIYLNSFFSVLTLIALTLNRFGLISTLLVLAPRGELSKGALGIKSFKKKVYILFVKKLVLLNKVHFHATSKDEQCDIHRVLNKNSVMLQNLITPIFLTSPPLKIEKNVGSVKLVFFSRVSRKKNLDFALQVLKQVTCLVEFDIWGPIEEADYWQQCLTLITQMPTNVAVSYKGALPREQVQKTLSNYHALLLPTRNENFGHAIVECMAVGLLPIISDQTPWRQLATYRIGWDILLSCPVDFVAAIHELANLNAAEFQLRSVNCQMYISKHSQMPLDGYFKLLSSI